MDNFSVRDMLGMNLFTITLMVSQFLHPSHSEISKVIFFLPMPMCRTFNVCLGSIFNTFIFQVDLHPVFLAENFATMSQGCFACSCCACANN